MLTCPKCNSVNLEQFTDATVNIIVDPNTLRVIDTDPVQASDMHLDDYDDVKCGACEWQGPIRHLQGRSDR